LCQGKSCRPLCAEVLYERYDDGKH